MFNEFYVNLDELLLDPNNPRFSLYHKHFVPEQQAEEKQEIILKKMVESSNFSVDELIDSIKSKGFIPAGKIFVKKVGNKYLVIEGNRRISAAKSLLIKHNGGKEADILDEEVYKSLLKIQVNDLTGKSENEIRQLVALIHLGGFKEWKPLPASFSIYREYMRELSLTGVKKESEQDKFAKNPNNFIYDPVIAKKIAADFAIKLVQVRKNVKIYRTHLQLMAISHDDERVEDENNYSMIGDTISDDALSKFFQYDNQLAIFSDEGAEKFLDLCLIGNENHERLITAPASGESNLRDLSYILGSPSSTDEDKKRVIVDRTPVGKVASSIRAREDSGNLHATLTQALTFLMGIELGMLNVSGGLASSEKKLVEKIESRLSQIKKASGE
jgi:hypothetical protein